MDYSSDSDVDGGNPVPQPQHHHHSFLSEVGKIGLDIGKGVVTEGIVSLL